MMKYHSGFQFVVLLMLLFAEILCPSGANAFTTTAYGKTITWDISGLGNITSQGCSVDSTYDYVTNCNYISTTLPPPGTSVELSASMSDTPCDMRDLLMIYNYQADTKLQSVNPYPIPATCNYNLSGSTVFFPYKPVLPHSLVRPGAFLIEFYGHPNIIKIYINLFNNTPFTIPGRPDLFGGKDDNPCTKLKDGKSPGT
jgi:hypothetical protein